MKFSIVIANYNSGKLLEEALLSVLNQNFNDYELIMVDAGSTDESLQTVLKYQNRFSWWCSEKDEGQSDAFNKGFSNAKGDYFFWLNADDLLLPNSLSSAFHFLESHKDCLWLTFNQIFINKNREIIFVNHGPKWINFLMHKVGPQVDAATSIFHRSLYEQSQKFDTRFYYAMDIDLWLQFMNLGYRYLRLKKYFYVFRIHSGSKTTPEGYNKTIKNEERISQGEIIRDKNNYHVVPFFVFINKIYKLFSCKIFSWINSYRLKGITIDVLNNKVTK